MIPNSVKMKFLPVTHSTVKSHGYDCHNIALKWRPRQRKRGCPLTIYSRLSYHTDSHIPCRVATDLDCVVPVWFTHAMQRPCRAPTMPLWERLYKATARQGNGTGTTWHMWINIGRLSTGCWWPASFGFFRLLCTHSQSLLTRTLLPFGMCFISLMTMETAVYTEYELILKLKPVFLLLLCYVSIVHSSFDCLRATTL